MSLLKTNKNQLGISSTSGNNFTLDASADDGTMKLSRGNAGATTQDILTINAAGQVAFPQGMVGSSKNKIINGDMRISQRGTTFANVSIGSYTLDRWQYSKAATVVHTISQSSDVPTFGSTSNFQNSLRAQVTTADTSVASSDYCLLLHNIEGYNITDLVGKTFTISFWVKNTKTGVHSVCLRNTGIDRSYVAEYTINVADTWEKKSITVVGGLPTSGTWNYTNGLGINIMFTLYCGTSYQTTPGSWQTGTFFSSVNQVNSVDSTSNNFYITGVQLEVGSAATEFEVRNYGTELALCMRYYEAQGDNMTFGFPCPSTGGFASVYTFPFLVKKRAAATIVYNFPTYSNVTAFNYQTASTVNWSFQVIGTNFTNTTFSMNFTASAEL